MTQRFIKYIPSEKSIWLRKNFPKAYLLLSVIAEQARRTKCTLDNLEVGDAILSLRTSSENAGITIKECRIALEKLCEHGFIEIVWNPKNKNDQKRAHKRAHKSYIINLCNSDIWDINGEGKGAQKGNQRAHEGHITRKNKNEKNVCLKETNKEKAVAIAPAVDLFSSNESQKKKNDFVDMRVMIALKEIKVPEQTLNKWLSENTPEIIIETVRIMQQQQTTISNPIGWITHALKNKYAQKIKFEQANREFAIEFKAIHEARYLVLKQSYCVDAFTGRDYYYHISPQEFRNSLIKLHETKLEAAQ